jgi:hypothetical protein
MQFFLLMPGDTEEDTLNEANLLGETSFGVFWTGSALGVLMTLIEQEPEVLPAIRIATDMSKRLFTIEEFLTTISKHKIRTQR